MESPYAQVIIDSSGNLWACAVLTRGFRRCGIWFSISVFCLAHLPFPIRPLRQLWGSPSRRMWNPERLRERPLRPRAWGLHLRLLRRIRVWPEQDGLYRWASILYVFSRKVSSVQTDWADLLTDFDLSERVKQQGNLPSHLSPSGATLVR